jgi:hypothetical protein
MLVRYITSDSSVQVARKAPVNAEADGGPGSVSTTAEYGNGVCCNAAHGKSCHHHHACAVPSDAMACDCDTMACDCDAMTCDCDAMTCDCDAMPCDCDAMACDCDAMACDCDAMTCDCDAMTCDCDAPSDWASQAALRSRLLTGPICRNKRNTPGLAALCGTAVARVCRCYFLTSNE